MTVPLTVMLIGPLGQVTINPFGTEVAISVTVPAKLNTLVRVTLTEMVVCPTFRSWLMFEIVKSPTCTVAVALCEAVPGRPVAVTLTA